MMAYLVSLLPVLLCPLSMGLMLWLMRDQHGAPKEAASLQAKPQGTQFRAAPLMHLLRCCFNWRVAAALVAVGGGLWLVAPRYAWAALPLLVVAICPLSMLLMLRGRRNHVEQAQPVVAPRVEQPLHPTNNVQGEYEPTT